MKDDIKDRYDKFIESCEILERDKYYRKDILMMQNDFYREMRVIKILTVEILDKYEKRYFELLRNIGSMN